MSMIIWSLFFVGIIVLAVIISLLFGAIKQMKEENRLNLQQIPILVKSQFEAEQNKMITELETRKRAIEGTVKGLEDELKEYKQLMQNFEKDRERKYGNLENELRNASQTTLKLHETTTKLNDILGNVKLRGQWGERMAEDIIRNAGLIEGVNYKKQSQLEFSKTQPDYTFLLPDNCIINMDVKFPLDNYLKMVNAKEDSERERFLKEFISNVKDRVKEIKDRGYISPKDNTLDFVLIFIPNEQVFSLIQEEIPELMDEALKQKVVLCSPFTLYAMLSVVRQAFENFRFESNLKKIIQKIDQFSKIYTKFKTRFLDIGLSIEKLDRIYEDIIGKSFKQIDAKIKQIDDYKKGNQLSIDDEVVPSVLKGQREEDAVL